MAILKLVFAFIMSFNQIINPFFVFLFHGGPGYMAEDWSSSQEFTADYCQEVKKDPNKDFVILNLTDIQLSPDLVFSERGEYTDELIDSLIKSTKPDLITLTGDNCTSMVGYIRLAKMLDSYDIPWAPIMGNHDGENGDTTLEGWDSYILTNSKNCLFKVGPKDMGYGNYVINITENGKIIHSLIMMDTHSDAGDTEAGKINYGKNEDGSDRIGYDHLWANQIEWYKWVVNGLKKLNSGETVETSALMHIPCYEYRTAREELCTVIESDGNKEYVPTNEEDGFGSLMEDICAPEGNNGFFDVVVDLGSTKNIIVGHDHVNDMSIVYKGVALNYSEKSGHGSYYNDSKQGGSTLVINSSGVGTFSHVQYK